MFATLGGSDALFAVEGGNARVAKQLLHQHGLSSLLSALAVGVWHSLVVRACVCASSVQAPPCISNAASRTLRGLLDQFLLLLRRPPHSVDFLIRLPDGRWHVSSKSAQSGVVMNKVRFAAAVICLSPVAERCCFNSGSVRPTTLWWWLLRWSWPIKHSPLTSLATETRRPCGRCCRNGGPNCALLALAWLTCCACLRACSEFQVTHTTIVKGKIRPGLLCSLPVQVERCSSAV